MARTDFSKVTPSGSAGGKSAPRPAPADPNTETSTGGVRGFLTGAPRWVKAVLFAAIVLTLVGGVAVVVGRGGDETPGPATAIRTGHGPAMITAGIPHGYDRTPAGAQTAAVNFMQTTDALGLGRVQLADVTAISLSASPTAAVHQMLQSTRSTVETGGESASTHPVLVNVVDHTDTTAKVSVWAMTAGQNAITDDTTSVVTVWSTATVTLSWENEDWKVSDWAFKSGPTPDEVALSKGDVTLADMAASGMYTFFVE